VFPAALESTAAEKLHKLGGPHDGVWDARSFDQFLLGDLRAEIAIVAPIDSYGGQRDVMANAGGLLRRKKVALGSLEKLQYRLVFERRRIGEIHNDLCPHKNLVEPLAGERVDPALGRCCDHLVTTLA
jgi:hypothetical protein